MWKHLVGLAGWVWICPQAAADWVTVTNANAIAINDGGGLIIPAKASPYPATNFVVSPPGLVAAKVTVTLRGFTHSFPSDVSILLVGPQGQRCILMSEVGGQSQFSVNDLTLALDDDAASNLPVYSALTPGVFKPANGYLSLHYPCLPYDFPPPAPAGNSNAPSALSVFKGSDPNGPWKLYVVDDAGSNSGIISGGWILNIATAVPLSAKRYPGNLVLAWTNAIAGCTLQCAPNLSGNWTNVLPAPVVVNGQYTVTNQMWNGAAFYRLIR